MKIAVCDDEKYILHKLEKILKEYPGESVQAVFFESGEALLEAVENFDVMLLDIDMEGMNGIQAAEQIRRRDKKVRIIYLTNYTDYSLSAFKVHAFAYILKNEDWEQVKKEIYKQLDEVTFYLKKEPAQELEFLTEQGHITLPCREILYFEYQSRKVRMVTGRGEYNLKKKITDVASEMKKWDFGVPHKSFVVNLYQIRSIKGNDICLSDGTLLPLSGKKAAGFRKELNRYLAQRIDVGGKSGV